MKTNFIVTLLALSPFFSYVVLSSCTPSQASYGPIKRDATGVRPYSDAVAPATISDSIRIEHARYIMHTVLALNTKAVPCTCDPNATSKNHN